jgi:hypothetical protein
MTELLLDAAGDGRHPRRHHGRSAAQRPAAGRSRVSRAPCVGFGHGESTGRASDLLHEAGEVHHVVYRITDGAYDDWASFYADWLIDHSELPNTLGRAIRSHLVHELASVSARLQRGASGPLAGRLRRPDRQPLRLTHQLRGWPR